MLRTYSGLARFHMEESPVRRLTLALVLLIGSAAQATAGTYVVNPDGSGDYATIQDAVDAASNGDFIHLGDGTFMGTGNVAVDFSGKVVWVRNFGWPDSAYGLASSLAFSKETVIFQFDQGSSGDDKLSAVSGLDPESGMTIWRTERPVGGSWSSPVVVNTGKRTIVVTCGAPWVIAYDPETGNELWRCDGLSGDVGPSPTYADGKVFVTNDGAQVMAIRTGGEGDVSKTHVVWTAEEGMSDASSPVCDGKFFLQATGGGGEVTCLDATNGKLLWQKGFSGGFWASPTIVGDLVYLPGDDGKTRLFKLADKFELVAENNIGEPTLATPAFIGDRIYIRGEKHLFCVGSKE